MATRACLTAAALAAALLGAPASAQPPPDAIPGVCGGGDNLCVRVFELLTDAGERRRFFDGIAVAYTLDPRNEERKRIRDTVVALATAAKSNQTGLATGYANKMLVEHWVAERVVQNFVTIAAKQAEILRASGAGSYSGDSVREYYENLADDYQRPIERLGFEDVIQSVRTEDFEQVAKIVNLPLAIFSKVSDTWMNAISGFAWQLLGLMAVFAFVHGGYQMIFGDLTPGAFFRFLAEMAVVVTLFGFFLYSSSDGKTMAGRFAHGMIGYFDAGIRANVCERMVGYVADDGAVGTDIDAATFRIDRASYNSLCDPAGVGTAGTADATERTFNPGQIVVQGIHEALFLVTYPSRMSDWGDTLSGQSLLGTMFGAVMGVFVFVLHLLIGLMIMLVWLEGFIVLAMGIFVLGFGVMQMTREIAMSYLRYIVAWAAKLVLMMLTYFFVYTVMDTALESVDIFREMKAAEAFNLVAFLLFGLLSLFTPTITIFVMNSVPDKVAGWIGDASSRAQDRVAGMAEKTTAMGVAATGITAAAAAKTVGGAGAAATGAAAGAARAGRQFEGATGKGRAMLKGGLGGAVGGAVEAGGAFGESRKAGRGRLVSTVKAAIGATHGGGAGAVETLKKAINHNIDNGGGKANE